MAVEYYSFAEGEEIRSKSTPEQLVGSLADRTPDLQSYPNAHHMAILASELDGTFDLTQVLERVAISHGIPVQLGDKQGVVFKQSKEQEAVDRWAKREFLDVERHIAKAWRRSLTAVNFEEMVRNVMAHLGHWRKPKDLSDAKQIADTMIDYIDPEWLLRFGLNLIGIPDAAEPVIAEWIKSRRPNLRGRFPYFVFTLTIMVFFCLVLPTLKEREGQPSYRFSVALLPAFLLRLHLQR